MSKASELIAQLRKIVEAPIDDNLDWIFDADEAMEQSADLIESQQKTIEELRAALLPFAEAADDLNDHHPDNIPIWESAAAMGIDAKHLRKAKALASIGKEEGE